MSDITATTVTADGVAVNHPARLKSVYYIRTSTVGSLILRDGGSSGNALLTLTVPATEAGEDESNTLSVPSDGLSFKTNIYVDVTNISSVTLFHG